MKKKWIQKVWMIVCLLVLGNFCLYAQTISVKGTIIDRENVAIPGANVLVQGTTTGVVTDADGKFSITVPTDAVLMISFVGYQPQKVVVGGRTALEVVLDEEVLAIDEVVVVGYGTIKKKDLTGAVSQVKAADIENKNPGSVQDILRGNVSGLNVGLKYEAKGGGDLLVRGKNTIKAGSSPLLVVDGVIYYGSMDDINPSDIETIDVLKDASSAAVFGAKSASGVVLITTKKGKVGKPVINFDGSVGWVTLARDQPVYDGPGYVAWRSDVQKSRFPVVAEQKPYMYDDPRNLPSNITTDAWLNYDGAKGDPVDVWLQRLSFQANEIENYKNGKETNWYDAVFQTGFRQDYNVSLSGKKEEMSYYWSIGYTDNEGFVWGDEFNALRSRLNLEGKIANFLTVGMNTQFSNRDESAVKTEWNRILWASPYGDMYNADGTYRRWPMGNEASSNNPFYEPTYTDRRNFINSLNANLYARLTLPYGFSYQVNFVPRFEWTQYLNHQSAKHVEWAARGGIVSRQHTEIYQWQVDNLLKWNKTFNKVHNFDVTLLANAEKFQRWKDRMDNEGYLPNDQLGYHNIDGGNKVWVTSSPGTDYTKSEDDYSDQVYTGAAYMARIFYSFHGRYMLTLTGRRDGYSAFGESNPWADFGSVAVGWVFSDESIMNGVSWLDYGKLRMSYGTNGNRDIPMYDASTLISAGGKYPYVKPDGSVNLNVMMESNRMKNTHLKWEETAAFNFGLDFTLFNNIIDGNIDMYQMTTKGLLVDRQLPPFIGYKRVLTNIGEMRNRGFEITLGANIFNHENLSWRVNANFSLNRGKILHLYGDQVPVEDANGAVVGSKEADDPTNKWFIGHAVDQIWDYKITGVWQESEKAEAAKFGLLPGDFRLNENGDGVYNDKDKEFQGYTSPRFRWMLRNEFNIFKHFDVSFMLYSQWGHYGKFNRARNDEGFMDRSTSYVMPYWTDSNPNNEYARLYSNRGGATYDVWWNKSFIRVDNISIAYTIPKNIVSKVKIHQAKIFASIQNVALFAPDWNYWDPEVGTDGDPAPRIYSIGINFTL